MSEAVLCPACHLPVAVKGIPKHTNGCRLWGPVIGVPPSEFNFDRHFKRRLYAEGSVEGHDYVVCLLCSDEHRAKRLADHLKIVHKMAIEDYRERFPGVPTSARQSMEQRSATVMKKYGTDNVARADEVRALLRENNRSQDPEVIAKRKATNRIRYGHENPFGGANVKARIREVMMDRHGAPSPQQVPEIRERTLKTNRDRYGADHYFETPEFQVKFKVSSHDRFGTDHPMQSKEGRALCESGCMDKWGVKNPLLHPDVQRRAYDTNLANHGGIHSQQCPDVLEKARQTWLEKYGVDNPSKTEEVKARIKDVWMGKYGVPFPPQSLWTNRDQSFPNKVEQAVIAIAPTCVVYSGDGSYWIRVRGSSHARNPDFVVLSGDQVVAYRAGTKLNDLRTYAIIEVFGDYWHGPRVTGKDRETHKLEVVDYYSKAGVHCLVLWESEIKKHPKVVAERILAFIEHH